MVFIETTRILLRQWQPDDLPTFAEMCGDPRVMQYFPKTLTPRESKQRVDHFHNSIKRKAYGFWAAEYKPKGAFIGFVGLNELDQSHPKGGSIEVGWRIHPDYWRRGLASEAARSCLEYAFTQLQCNEVVSQTPVVNKASIGVMHKIGMRDSYENFSHHLLPRDSKLSEHVLYKISRQQWQREFDNAFRSR